MKKITKAILPVAGLGTRFLPATKAMPKEMLSVFDTPAIELIVRDAIEAGITEIIIVTGRDKRAIEDHFDKSPWLEQKLQEKGKLKELEIVRNIGKGANFAFVRQAEPLGDGHAILQAKPFVGDEPCVVLFGDDLVKNDGGKNAIEQLLDVYYATKKPVALLEEVNDDSLYGYGVVSGVQDEKGFKINQLIEKPTPEEAPSNLGTVGKFIITKEIWDHLDNNPPSKDGEIRLANAFEQYLASGEHMYGKVLEGERYDTGNKVGYLKATIDYAFDDPKVKEEIKKFVEKL